MLDLIHGDGLADEYEADAIITDPEYDNQPDVRELLRRSRGNVILFCDPLKRPGTPDEILYWIKTPSTKNTSKRCSRFVEEIHIYRKGSVFNPIHWSCMTGVFTDTLCEPTIHPWQKPLSLMQKLIYIYTNPGDNIVDPFAGSGTTLLAAKLCGRNALGFEKDKERFEAASKRLNA